MKIPGYVAIEGVIGVGKTSLATLLAERFQRKLILEEVEENPFLSRFYDDPKTYAFQTQIFFLLSRHRQQRELLQQDLFGQHLVSDYLFAKDKIFAYLNLDENELALYEHLLPFLEKDVPKPDLVIYLQTSVDILLQNIKLRGRTYEEKITKEYINELNEAYNRFFFHYTETPLIVVNVKNIDFVNNPADFEDLAKKICNPPKGTYYYVPVGR
ncbi:MAG: deoxynucleoside kinase [Candidatus Edwardsbacteria bacterium]